MTKEEADELSKSNQHLIHKKYKKNKLYPSQKYYLLKISTAIDLNKKGEYNVRCSLQHLIKEGATISEEFYYFKKNYSPC